MKTTVGYLFLFMLSVLIETGCSERIENRTTCIKGNIQNPVGKYVYLYSYPDSLSLFLDRMVAIDSSLIDEHGNYKLCPDIGSAAACSLKMGDSMLVSNMFLAPGYDIHLNFIGNNFAPEFETSNPGSDYNNYLLNLVQRFYKDPATKYFYYITTNYIDIFTFSAYIEERRKRQLVFYGNYFKNRAADKNFSTFALNQITYQYGIDKLMWRWKKRMKNEPVENDTTYYNFLTQAFVQNNNAVICPSYIRFLNLYIKDLYERQVENITPTGHIINEPVSLTKYYLTLKHLKGIQREIVLSNLIFDDMKDVSENRFKNSFHKPYTNNQQGKNNGLPEEWLLSFKNKYSIK